MISRVRGQLLRKEIDRAEIRTSGGVTYELQIPATTYERLSEPGADVELFAALLVRDESLDLYGFGSELERRLFLRLQSASGVGPRLALTLLGAMNAEQLVQAIRERDLGRLRAVSGVGKKKAERIAVELADKLEDMAASALAARPEGAQAEAAVSALVALGYDHGAANEAVRRAMGQRDGRRTDVESLVKEALAALS